MTDKNNFKIGIDAGSTTLKTIVLNSNNATVYKNYVRHKADVTGVFMQEIDRIGALFPDNGFAVMITGSAGMGMAERTQISFVQEVISSIEVIRLHYPDIHTLVDLGGEDAKIVFFEQGNQPDIRMNGSCAGGTGAFIDQMADLMDITIEDLGKMALEYKKIYPVASRCGVFAKTDVQNLISRNIPLPDIAMSILHTVALQAITTLVRGHKIVLSAAVDTDIHPPLRKPSILCTGGPLTFIPALRRAFANVLQLTEDELLLPENSEYFSAWGCALLAGKEKEIKTYTITELKSLPVKKQGDTEALCATSLPPLFESRQEYLLWKENRNVKPLLTSPKGMNGFSSAGELKGALFLGIDSGSTTTKILIMDENENIVFTFYAANQGNPLKKAVDGLQQFNNQYNNAIDCVPVDNIAASCSTGYGEELIKSALNLDFGIVETMAHLSGAQWVNPEVSFVLDIGGQDMKSIFVRNGVISNVELNEACSSGCGSFLQNFSATMNLEISDFVRLACLARHPADLGTRCTVFMNSKVKQSLRENATIGDIAAGLAYSVVKNCLFKVLKISNLNILGDNIVVQGGTFRNDAVYRALELLSGKNVSTTDMPEMMGALGAALYAKNQFKNRSNE